eukprot:TRINITY_DN26769_c0_g1_i1.p1 TRINITY_DN26769_c0_g1~~TRINITY_DN26769_c0_g1_i1.p1  ORF type:complete len:600 (+),score=128.22 TRINITY_DN26769_c0_g1_i1:87-1886(+)
MSHSSAAADETALQEDGRQMASGVKLTGDLARAAKIFGGGPVLHTVQQAHLFDDSKHFVDMPLKQDPEVVLAAFEKISDKKDREKLKAFVDEYFEDVGSELQPWTPEDMQESPPMLAAIKDAAMQKWALSLNKLWASLGRKPSSNVAEKQQRHSSLPQPFPTVVPGGRFRETYYWDTYWVVRGLLVCGMLDTAIGVVENMLDSVRRFGFVPNGTRVYYLDRSQPPLLTDMALAVYSASGNKTWLKEVLPVLEAEYNFWMSPRSGHMAELSSGQRLNVYQSARRGPRPESYSEDLETAMKAASLGRQPKEVYRGLCSGAESGWDFSTRWLSDGLGGADMGKADLTTIQTHNIVPVDLNAFLLRVEQGLAFAHEELHGEKTSAVSSYRKAASNRRSLMNEYLWDSKSKSYRDFRLDVRQPSQVIALSDFSAALWAGLLGPDAADTSTDIAERMVASLQASGLLQSGGAASSSVNTKRETQWDAPNAWPPLQLMLIEGLEKLPASSQGPSLAEDLGRRWLSSCYAAYQKFGYMYEKYNADRPGEGGEGGEYDTQVGFGWSNGVVLVLLARNWTAVPMQNSEYKKRHADDPDGRQTSKLRVEV